MKGRPRVTFQDAIGMRWEVVKTKLGNYFWIILETYGAYDPDFNAIMILSEFSPREKFLTLAHEYIHYFLWHLPEYCVVKLDKWHDKLSVFVQHAPILSLPTALGRQEKNRKLARRLTQSEIERLQPRDKTGK